MQFFNIEGEEETKNENKIWKGLPEDKKINVQNIKLQGQFLKQSKNQTNQKPIDIILDEDDNLYLQKNGELKGYFQLKCCYLEIIKNQQLQNENENKTENLNIYGFKFQKNNRELFIFTFEQNQFEIWKKPLIQKTIQKTFHEDYLVTKMLGKGASSKVYLGIKKEDGQQYAIKCFNKKKIENALNGKQALINEMQIMKKVSSPYIIKLYEVYESSNSIYFILQTLIGGELMDRLKNFTSIKEYDIQQLMKNLLTALEHLHHLGIMHRDLKPQNLLLRCKSNNYDIVVADLGLACYFNDKNPLFKRCGTPGYIAPEVLKLKEEDNLYGFKCDIFSAGIIFYLLLTGKTPFQNENYKNVITLNKLCNINFDIPELKKVSKQALDLLYKMLQVDFNQRPSSTECLNHQFFSQEYNEINVSLANLDNIQNYREDLLINQTNKLHQFDSVDNIQSPKILKTIIQSPQMLTSIKFFNIFSDIQQSPDTPNSSTQQKTKRIDLSQIKGKNMPFNKNRLQIQETYNNKLNKMQQEQQMEEEKNQNENFC